MPGMEEMCLRYGRGLISRIWVTWAERSVLIHTRRENRREHPRQWGQAGGPLWRAFRSGQVVMLPDPAAGAVDDGLGQLAGLEEVSSASVRGAVFLAGEWGGELPVIVSIYLDRAPDAKVLREIDRYEPLVTQALAVVEY